MSLLTACGKGAGAPPPTPPPPTPPPAATFAIGGTVSGLTGTGLVLQNNSGDDLTLSSNGSFAFLGRLATGATYDVTIRTQPSNPVQSCVTASGSGTVPSANVTNVTVTCNAAAFTIGGAVSGLTGTLVVQNNGGDDQTISANGPFVFSNALTIGASYSVSVRTQPAGQTCTVSNGGGVASASNITNVGVSCSSQLAVTATTPANNASAVSRDSSIVIQFSAAVDPATINGNTITLATAGGDKPVTFGVSGNEVTVTPVTKLALAAMHTLVITTGVQGARGETLAAKVTKTFRVRDGQWGTPTAIQSGMNGFYPQVAFDRGGNAIAVWTEGDSTGRWNAWNRYVAGSGWGTAAPFTPTLSTLGAPQLAVDADGNAFATWNASYGPGDYRGLVSRYVRGVGWEPEVLLGGNQGVSQAKVAVDARGNAMTVWEENDGTSLTTRAKRYAAGVWEAGVSLGSAAMPIGNSGMGPQVAMDQDGNAIATYRVVAGLFHDAWARRFVPGSGWEPATLIDSEVSSVNIIPVAFDSKGNAFAVWTQGTANFGPSSIWANRYVPGSGWEQAVVVEHEDLAPGQAPSVALDAAGNAIVVWQHLDFFRSQTDIWANRYVAGVGWGNAVLIENQRLGNANDARVAMDPSGNAIAVWKEFDGSRYDMWANRYVAGSGWGTAQRLETTDGAVSDVGIAMDVDGNAFAIWSQQPTATSGTTLIYVNRFE